MKIIYKILQNLGLVVVSLGLLFGGIAILQSGIPFWSLLYGGLAITLGIIVSVLTFNELTKRPSATSGEFHYVACRICHKQTLAPMILESTICQDCQYKMAQRLNLTAIILFLAFSIPVGVFVVGKSAEIRQNAAEVKPSVSCESGDWSPQICRCGQFDAVISCERGQKARFCGSEVYCCNGLAGSTWQCQKR